MMSGPSVVFKVSASPPGPSRPSKSESAFLRSHRLLAKFNPVTVNPGNKCENCYVRAVEKNLVKGTALTHEILAPAHQDSDHGRNIFRSLATLQKSDRRRLVPEKTSAAGDVPCEVHQTLAGLFTLRSHAGEIRERCGGEINRGTEDVLAR